jgi:hypothetical protein
MKKDKVGGPDVDHISLEPAKILAVEAGPAGNRLPVTNVLKVLSAIPIRNYNRPAVFGDHLGLGRDLAEMEFGAFLLDGALAPSCEVCSG